MKITSITCEGVALSSECFSITILQDESNAKRYELVQNVSVSDTVMFNYDTFEKHALSVGGIEHIYHGDEGCWEFTFKRSPNATQLMMFLEKCLADTLK